MLVWEEEMKNEPRCMRRLLCIKIWLNTGKK